MPSEIQHTILATFVQKRWTQTTAYSKQGYQDHKENLKIFLRMKTEGEKMLALFSLAKERLQEDEKQGKKRYVT